mgnify:CR=1 FL=1
MTERLKIDAYGRVTEPATLVIERLLPGPASRIWAYLTDADMRRKWLADGEMVILLEREAELSLIGQAMAALGYVELRQEKRIYDATPGMLMQVADEHRHAELDRRGDSDRPGGHQPRDERETDDEDGAPRRRVRAGREHRRQHRHDDAGGDGRDRADRAADGSEQRPDPPPRPLEELLADTELLTSVLTYHVINTKVDSTKITGAKGEVKTVWR